MTEEFRLTPFVTPSLTTAVARTLQELEDQGVNLDELKDVPKIPVRKKFNQGALNELVDLKSKGNAIPGQSLTNSPEAPYKWEQPPTFTHPRMALEHIVDLLIDRETMESLIASLHDGIAVTDITSMILYSGFQEGKWTPDIIALLLEPVLYLIILMAEEAGIEYIIDQEGAREEQNVSDKELGRRAKEEISMFDKMVDEVLARGINPASVPPELVTKISERVPSMLDRTVDEQSLLRRSNDG